ncbi:MULTISPECIES: DNA-binding protein [unclassified Pseudomonas]|uniref:DNA-binding protein n=1 Tax=unclassified Pseudomonas TaxID=196821 RepID=UPI002AB567B1|nr:MULTISPECIES: DNA-binding protein [unclassified Pseudomonas]MDY7560446.1 DNA-binding protein [Pseudomonas sp. AB6]MEA9975958.1 DNA-binding protein [Pseudomonas sp. RTS4]MEA9993203.1 DNA-binding protein [Pseudomonas sp. AA4]MEB0043108.1 DNA-binding protein [Pseudomonas sp. MH10]MEB0077721.1 DNA-binding protein [Pseudomonas sp. MH10out]
MARSGVLYVHVAHAAAQLVADGRNPTIDSIRAALGETGSKSTIAPLLKRWKAAHPGTLAQAELGLPAELVLALKGLYEKVQAEAAIQLQQAVEAHQSETAALQEQLQQAFVERDASLNVQKQQTHALAAATTRSQELADTVQRQEIVLAGLGSEKLGLEQRLADRAAEVASLTQQLQHSRVQFEHYQASVAQQRADERQSAEQRHHRLEQELTELRQLRLAQQTRLGELQAQEQRRAQDNDLLKDALLTAEEALTQSRSAQEHLTYQLTELKQGHMTLQQHHAQGEQCLVETLTRLAVIERERSFVAERLTQAETQLTELATEKQLLLQEKAVLSSQLAEFRRMEPTPSS